jgi:DNA invertase Pin-like site-specific DNA recombinase
MYALYHALSRNEPAARPYLDRLVADMNAGRTSPVVVAWTQAALGRTNEALSLMEIAFRQRDRKLLNIKVHPLLESIRGTDRFQAILSRMRLV